MSETICGLVTAIKRHIADAERAELQADNNRLAAGKKLIVLRTRIEAGEVGTVSWWQWYASNFDRSRRDAERLMAMAGADDPEAALAAEQAKARQGMAKSRARKKAAEAATNVSRTPLIEAWEASSFKERREFLAYLATIGQRLPKQGKPKIKSTWYRRQSLDDLRKNCSFVAVQGEFLAADPCRTSDGGGPWPQDIAANYA